MLVAVHLPPGVTIPAALLLAALAGWLVSRPVRAGTPPSRTRIRRASMGVRVALLGPLVWGLSFADPAAEPLEYVWVWGAAVGLLALSFLLTAADVANSARLRERARRDLEAEALARMAEDAERGE